MIIRLLLLLIFCEIQCCGHRGHHSNTLVANMVAVCSVGIETGEWYRKHERLVHSNDIVEINNNIGITSCMLKCKQNRQCSFVGTEGNVGLGETGTCYLIMANTKPVKNINLSSKTLYVTEKIEKQTSPVQLEKTTTMIGPCYESDTGYYGNDITRKTNILSWQNCNTECEKEPRCQHWTWNPKPTYNNYCNLKTSNAGKKYQKDSISGPRGCEDIRSVLSCELSWADLSCDNSNVINILTANYGRTDTTVCANYHDPNAHKNTNCREAQSLQIVKNECERKKSCRVQASTNVFGGDPCYGTYKYLEITYECKTIDPTLLVHLQFDHIFGNKVQDQSSYGNNAVMSGSQSIVQTTGKPYYALKLAQGDDLIIDGTKMTKKPRDAITIALWVRLIGSTSGSHSIFDTKGDSHQLGQYHFEIRNGGGIRWFHRNDAQQVVFDINTANVITKPSTWYHIASMYDSSTGKASVYINGKKVAEKTGNGLLSEDWNKRVGFGSHGNARVLNGEIGDVRIYDIALTAYQVEELARVV